MKLMIVISCILANGQHVHPHGHYTAWTACNKRIEYFQTKLYPTIGNMAPLCWCHQAPEQVIRYDENRKAPL